MAEKLADTEAFVESIRVHSKGVIGCVRHKKDIMISLTKEGDKNFYDFFLTQEQAESLLKELTQRINQNKSVEV